MWNIDEIIGVEREESTKKPEQGCSGYQLGTTALNFQENYNTFRIRCIMLILEKLTFMPLVHLQQINTEMVQYSCPCKKKKNGHYVANG